MKHRLFTILSGLSLLAGVAMATMWIKSYFLGDTFGWGTSTTQKMVFQRYEVSSLNGSLSFGGFEMRFDDSGMGPFEHPGWFWWSNMSTIGHRGWFTSRSLWTRMGFDVYKLVTVGRGGKWTDWGVVMPFWLVIPSLGVLPAVCGFRIYRRQQDLRRSKLGHCVRCGYDLRATPGRCPECGTAVAAMRKEV
jgi:hypothetical protein